MVANEGVTDVEFLPTGAFLWQMLRWLVVSEGQASPNAPYAVKIQLALDGQFLAIMKRLSPVLPRHTSHETAFL